MVRPLADMIVDVVGAISPAPGGFLRVTRVLLDLPLEVQLRQAGGEIEFLGDLPRWRWTSEYDPRRGRIRLECVEGGAL